MITKKIPGVARDKDRGSAPVSGVGESVPLSRTSGEQRSFQRDAETHARDGRAPQPEEIRYAKRRLPHFEKPWAIYALTMTTRRRKTLSAWARTIVLNAFTHFHARRYELFAACIMPDHAHLLFQPWPKAVDPSSTAIFWSISELMHSLKSFTAHEINKVEESHGPVWEEEVFDRYIRSESDLQEKFCYICRNPWDTGIAGPSEDYPWLWTPEDMFRTTQASQNEDRFGETPKPTPGTGALPKAINAHLATETSISTRPPTLD